MPPRKWNDGINFGDPRAAEVDGLRQAAVPAHGTAWSTRTVQ